MTSITFKSIHSNSLTINYVQLCSNYIQLISIIFKYCYSESICFNFIYFYSITFSYFSFRLHNATYTKTLHKHSKYSKPILKQYCIPQTSNSFTLQTPHLSETWYRETWNSGTIRCMADLRVTITTHAEPPQHWVNSLWYRWRIASDVLCILFGTCWHLFDVHVYSWFVLSRWVEMNGDRK